MEQGSNEAPKSGMQSGLALSALEESRQRKERRESLRKAKSSTKSQAELDQELWRSAEAGSFERVAALIGSGALPGWRERVDYSMAIVSKRQEAMATVGPMERAACLGNVGFLRAAQEAGWDPFENVEGWEQLLEIDGVIRFGSTNPKQASWLEAACSKDLSAKGVQVMSAWARGSGASMAGSTMNKMAWRPAIALAKAAGPLAAGDCESLVRMLARWDYWSRGKEEVDALAMELAKAVASREVQGVAKEALWVEAFKSRAGACACLALSALGDPPLALPWAKLLNHGGVPKGANLPVGPHSSLLAAICCNAMEIGSILSRVPGQADAAKASCMDARAWAWAQSSTLRQAKELRALGFDLLELDERAQAIGAQAKPKMVEMAARSDGVDLALSIGRLDNRLWFAKDGSGSDGWSALAKIAPSAAAKVESLALRKDSSLGAAKASKAERSKRL